MSPRLSSLPVELGPVIDDRLATLFEYNDDLSEMAYSRLPGTETWVPVRVEQGESLSQYWEFNLFYAPLDQSFRWLGATMTKKSGSFSAQWKEAAQSVEAFSTGGQMDLIVETNNFAQKIHDFNLTASVVMAMQRFDYAAYIAEQARIKTEWLAENPVNWAELYVAEAAEHTMTDFTANKAYHDGSLYHYTSYHCACGHQETLTNTLGEYDLVKTFAAHQATATATAMAALIRKVTGF